MTLWMLQLLQHFRGKYWSSIRTALKFVWECPAGCSSSFVQVRVCRQTIAETCDDLVVCTPLGFMMTSSNGNIFRVTGTLWGEATGHRWIPLTKASDARPWCHCNVSSQFIVLWDRWLQYWIRDFQTHLGHWCLKHFLWNSIQICATGSRSS